MPASTTGSPAKPPPSPRQLASSTSTSTPQKSAKTAPWTSRSSATAARLSQHSSPQPERPAPTTRLPTSPPGPPPWTRSGAPTSYDKPADGALSPEFVIQALGKAAGPHAIYTSGVGQHQMWAAHYIHYERPRTWLNSGGLGTMGYAVPAAIGAKLAAPSREVWAIDGDGCFQMTNQELATAAIEGIPIKVALINNGNLGMVRQLQEIHYGGRYSNVDLATHSRRIPDFVKLSEALGCVALRCDREEDVDSVIAQARAIDDRPVVIDFIVGDDALVWPMIAARASNDDIMAARGIRPLFTEND